MCTESHPPVLEVMHLMKGLDIAEIVKDCYKSDPTFHQIIAALTDHKNFVEVDKAGFVYLKQNGTRTLGIPKVSKNGKDLQRTGLIKELEAHQILTHLGLRKTLHFLKDSV